MTIDPTSRSTDERMVSEHRPTVDVTPVVPAGWFVKMSWTVLAPDGQANVIASSEPLSPHLSTDTYAATQGELLRKEFTGYHEYSMFPILIDGHPAWLREFAWVPPDGGAVTQHQLYCVVSTADGRRGITATATTPSHSIDRFREVFAAALGSLRIASAPITAEE